MNTATTDDTDLEQLVLKESIVNATGLSEAKIQVGLRGDPSMRETTFSRPKYLSSVDAVIDSLEANLEELLLNRSIFRLYVGFNNGEVRTHSVFDPLRMEIHDAEKVADKQYIDRHFPAIPYDQKMQAIRAVYDALESSGVYQHLPDYWRRILKKRNSEWQPMDAEDIPGILASLKRLREVDDYYIRNITICSVQDFVHMQFNCDGTQLVHSDNYKTFLKENLPG